MTEFAGLKQVWFVVSPQNPLKKKETLLADHHRLYMTQLAIGDSDRLKASDIEFRMAVPSYTIDTLTFLQEKYPKNEFCLVMGEDNLYTLHKWKNAEELIKKYPIYYYPRPDTVKPSSAVLEHMLSIAKIHRVGCSADGYFRHLHQEWNKTRQRYVILPSCPCLEVYQGDAFL